MSPIEYQGFVGKIFAILIPVMTAVAAIAPRYRRMSDLQIAYEIGRRVGHYESRVHRNGDKRSRTSDPGPLATEG